MKKNRDFNVLKHILEYCNRIEETICFFGDDGHIFQTNHIYKDAVSLCILQIGELSGILSDELKEKYKELPWKQIKALRNIVAHRYGTIDAALMWDIVKEDLPSLQKYCKQILVELKASETAKTGE